jgi:hypothetical protein
MTIFKYFVLLDVITLSQMDDSSTVEYAMRELETDLTMILLLY